MDREDRIRGLESAQSPFVTPSLLDCDFARVGEQLDGLASAGAVAVHLDVMDGHFVPNISYGPPVVADWRPRTDLPFDAHLMISEPDRYLDAFVEAGVDVVLVHIEVLPDPVPLLRRIRSAGCRAGLVLNPPTPTSAVEPYLAEVDRVLVMSVQPGFGGQSFDPSALAKLRRFRSLRPELPLSVDGGIKSKNAAEAVEAGATQLVVGSAIFRPDGDLAAALAEVTEAARRGPRP